MLAGIAYIKIRVMLMIPNKLAMKRIPPPNATRKSQYRRVVFQTPHCVAIFGQAFRVIKSLTLKGAEKSIPSKYFVYLRSLSFDNLGHPTTNNRPARRPSGNAKRYCFRNAKTEIRAPIKLTVASM